ncbi:hypothetical protein, partial [Escherichia coli]|uniref:hypothetical protein n=3 Tax=Escherichia coli TaxID=562 RepID=UPI0031B62320
VPAYGPQNDVTLKMPAFEWVHVQLHQQKGMISLSPPTICNSANPRRDRGFLSPPWTAHKVQQLFLHLVKRLPTIAAIVYSKLLQFCGDDRHKWP